MKLHIKKSTLYLILLFVIAGCVITAAIVLGRGKPSADQQSSAPGAVHASGTVQAADIPLKKVGTVLMYHLVSENKKDWSNWCVSPETLENDIISLKKKGYTFIRTRDLHKLEKRQDITPPYVMLTLDDGNESDYQYVFPIIERQQVPATFFVVGAYIDKPGCLSTEQIAMMSKSQYVDFGSHGFEIHDKTAAQVRALFKDPSKTEYLVNDFKRTFELLQSITYKRPVAISYPYGIYTDSVDQRIKQEFKHIATYSTRYGPITLPFANTPLCRLNRAASYTIDKVDSPLK